MSTAHRRLRQAGVAGLVLLLPLTGCAGLKKSIDKINESNTAYFGLQAFIQQRLDTKLHRPVRSVSCTPHVDQIQQSSSATMNCLVRFTNGTSYTTQGTVTNPSTDPDYTTYNYSFYDPPPVDITKAPLPNPTVTLAATSRQSFFAAGDLEPVARELDTRFGAHDLIIQLAIYPGEVEAVVAAEGGRAWPVSASASGGLKVGAQVAFSGSRTGIYLSQFVPDVIPRLARQVAADGGVPVARIRRFVLDNSLPGGNSGWNIYPVSGAGYFQADLVGDHLLSITATGRRVLS